MKKLILALLLGWVSGQAFGDSKITGMPATTTLSDTDIIPVVTDPGGTPVNNKITKGNYFTNVSTISVSSATATSINVGALRGASLTTCGDATHGLAWGSGQFSCQSITGSGGGGGGDDLGSHIATMTVTANYGITGTTITTAAFNVRATSASVTGTGGLAINATGGYGVLLTSGQVQFASSMTVVSGVHISSNAIVDLTGAGSNNTPALLNIYKNSASLGDYLLAIGSNQQIDQFVVRDQSAFNLSTYGLRAGNLRMGEATFADKILSANTVDQHINYWSSGDLIVQTGALSDGGRDIILKPRIVEAMRLSNANGVIVTSSMTVTAAGGVGVTYGVIVGTITINNGGSSGKTMCWKTATTLGFCSSVVGAGGDCTCN
jgi:hypothetical protein